MVLFSWLALAPVGCGGRARQEIIETELHARDVQLRSLVSELGKSELRADALRHEVSALRKGAKISPEQAGAVFGLRRINLGRTTGGIDDDALVGDEALAVFVEPRDSDDHIIKVPGARLHLLVLEINFQGLKVPLCSWDFSAEQLRQSWKEGLLSTGYYLKLPWKVFPHTENLRIVARLILPDDRLFEADKDIRVRLVPGKSLPGPEVFPEKEVAPGFVPPVVPPPEPLPGMVPETGPPPALMPGPILPPPASQMETPARWQSSDRTRSTVEPARWEPASLRGAVRLGRPTTTELPTPPPQLP